MRDSTRFVNYQTDETGRTVTGVVVRGADGDVVPLSADLTVDASGRTSRTPKWLETQGFDPPNVGEVTVDLAPAPRLLSATQTTIGHSGHQRPPRLLGVAALYPSKTVSGRWSCTVHGDDPPRNADEFRDFASMLQIPELSEILDGQPIPPENVDYYPFPSNRRRFYEKLDGFPDGLLVVGDAIASYNPIYGQGMSVVALHALVLHHTLANDGQSDLALEFFDGVEPVVDAAWLMAVGADFQFPNTTGPKPRGTDLMGWYLSRLTRKAHTDRELSERFIRVIILENRLRRHFGRASYGGYSSRLSGPADLDRIQAPILDPSSFTTASTPRLRITSSIVTIATVRQFPVIAKWPLLDNPLPPCDVYDRYPKDGPVHTYHSPTCTYAVGIAMSVSVPDFRYRIAPVRNPPNPP